MRKYIELFHNLFLSLILNKVETIKMWGYTTWSMLYLLRNSPGKIKESQRRRGLDPSVVDRARLYDEMWRQKLSELNELRHEHNVITREIAKCKDPELRRKKIEDAKRLLQRISSLEEEVRRYKELRDEILLSIPNIVHESVPEGVGEEDNVPVMFYGKPKVWKGYLDRFLSQVKEAKVEYEIIEERPLSHYEMGYALKMVDTERAAKIAGSRFYYLLEDLVWLEFALILYALDHLSRKGFIVIEPPFMMRRAAYEGVISLSDFEDAIYKLEDEDLYLIATSEHPIAAMYMNEVLVKDELPLKYAGVSPCFRKEAGAHGKDTKGIFRVHQFNKVEQFVFSLPEDSWKMHEELLNNAVELWKGLGMPFRVVNVCTGDLGAVAAKKYDIEVWMPGQGRFREVVSCSNCTDYQSYRLNIRYAKAKGLPAEGYVHTLNSTAIATSRAITAILENYQLEEGVVEIPKVLRRYLEPFPKAPKDAIKPRVVGGGDGP